MKKKTTKMSKVIENNITDLKKTFKELRADEDYYSLGQIFWDIFLFEDRKSELFKAAVGQPHRRRARDVRLRVAISINPSILYCDE
jgi:hypothetical protein